MGAVGGGMSSPSRGLLGSGGAGGLWGAQGDFLPTDPRGGRGQTGGSSKAAQYVDDEYIGYASPTAKSSSTWQVQKPVNPYYQARTTDERKKQRLDAGVAPTHDNMGSLAVADRANTETLHARGEMTGQDKKNMRIIGARAQDTYNFKAGSPNNLTGPMGPKLRGRRSRQMRKHAEAAYADKVTGGDGKGLWKDDRTKTPRQRYIDFMSGASSSSYSQTLK